MILYTILSIVLLSLPSRLAVKSPMFPYYYDQQDYVDDDDGKIKNHLVPHHHHHHHITFEGRTATVPPIQQSSVLTPQLKTKQLHETIAQSLRETTLVLMKELMKDIAWMTNFIKKIFIDNEVEERDMREVEDVLQYVNLTHRELADFYNKILQNQYKLTSMELLNAYDHLRKGSRIISSILELLASKYEMVENRQNFKQGKQQRNTAIAWSYYDDSMGG